MMTCPGCLRGILRARGLLLYCDKCPRVYWWHYPSRLVRECEDRQP